MQAIGATRILVLLLHPTLTCLSQTKITIFRLVQIRLSSSFWPVGLSRPVTFTSLKIVVFFWDTQIRLRQRSIPGALFVPMVFILSTLFYYLEKCEQAYRPRRRGLVGPLVFTMKNDRLLRETNDRSSLVWTNVASSPRNNTETDQRLANQIIVSSLSWNKTRWKILLRSCCSLFCSSFYT